MQNSEKNSVSSLSKKCLHCNTEFVGKGDYCCIGCKTANNLISNLGLNNFYKYLENQISRETLNLNTDHIPEDIDMTEFIHLEEDGSYELNLFIEGLHCSSCVWLIEEALKRQEDVIFARLNMSTKRLVIKWRDKKKLGNDYANLIRKMGYKATAFDPETINEKENKEQKDLLLALAVAGFASGNIMLLSVALWSTTQEIMGVATRDFIHLIAGIIALPTIVYSGRIFFKSAFRAVLSARTNMDVPISIAIIITSIISILEWSNSAEHTYFDSVTMLVFFLLIGRYLDIRSKNKARSAATDMLRMIKNSAMLVNKDGSLKSIPTSKLKIGDIVQVVSGDKIPIDGKILEGTTEIDTGIITGESVPRAHKKGDNVFAGCINLGSQIRIEVTKTSKNSLISEVIKLMEEAESSNTKYNSISEKAVKIYAPLVYFAGIITFLYWYYLQHSDFKDSLIIAISVLIITCPCAFGLAVPAVQILSSGKLFKLGIMLKNGNALEVLSKVSTAIFDKTGTLTLGKPKLLNAKNIDKKYLKIAASMAINSKHPYSKAIYEAYNEELLKIKTNEHAGNGLESSYQNKKYRLGKPEWTIEAQGEGVSLTENGKEVARFKFSDQLKDDANKVIEELKLLNINSKLISGDNEKEVKKIAKNCGIDDYVYAAMPNEKVASVKALKDKGEVILMVGDGLNDAPALAFADVSMSPASAIDITQNSADIVFQGEKLKPITTCIRLAKNTVKIIKQNFLIAFIYNFVAIPIAFFGYVTPLVAAAAMSFSSILVVLNSFRVK